MRFQYSMLVVRSGSEKEKSRKVLLANGDIPHTRTCSPPKRSAAAGFLSFNSPQACQTRSIVPTYCLRTIKKVTERIKTATRSNIINKEASSVARFLCVQDQHTHVFLKQGAVHVLVVVVWAALALFLLSRVTFIMYSQVLSASMPITSKCYYQCGKL